MVNNWWSLILQSWRKYFSREEQLNGQIWRLKVSNPNLHSLIFQVIFYSRNSSLAIWVVLASFITMSYMCSSNSTHLLNEQSSSQVYSSEHKSSLSYIGLLMNYSFIMGLIRSRFKGGVTFNRSIIKWNLNHFLTETWLKLNIQKVIAEGNKAKCTLLEVTKIFRRKPFEVD